MAATTVKRKRDKYFSKSKEENANFEPKLTRSKAKKLFRNPSSIVWPVTPIKKLTENDLDLINDELPEESDDEEYRPSIDDLQDHSEEESGRHSIVSTSSHTSALELSVSQYLENFDANLLETTPMKSTSDNLFKVPLENIGQRTRSKLCLSDTPLEAIEKAFVPPDITTDMYDFQCDNEDWENFLKEFMQPLSNDLDDDDEADPEYNALADEEEMYKEELRRDKAVKISRKELRKLMAELLECPDEFSSDEEKEISVKAEIANKINSEMSLKPQNAKEVEPNGTIMTKSQILLLNQQFRQHVQLTTQHFLQTFLHPIYGNYAEQSKINLASLLELSKGSKNSAFNIYNLKPAFDLVEKWEKFLISDKGSSVIDHMKKEVEMSKKAKKKSHYHRVTFHPSLLKLMSESDVFMYSLLLPPIGFRCDGPLKMEFASSEDSLIAIGLDEFTHYLKQNPRWFDKYKFSEKAACDLISEYLIPVKSSSQLTRHIRQVKGFSSNPINYYRNKGKAPKTVHYVIPFNEHLKQPPCKRPKEILPEMFRNFLYPEKDDGNKENNEDCRKSNVNNSNVSELNVGPVIYINSQSLCQKHK